MFLETNYFAGEEGVVIPKHVVEEDPEMTAKVELEIIEDGPEVKGSGKMDRDEGRVRVNESQAA